MRKRPRLLADRFHMKTRRETKHTALAKMSLKLEAKKAPMEVLVIDSADKAPREN